MYYLKEQIEQELTKLAEREITISVSTDNTQLEVFLKLKEDNEIGNIKRKRIYTLQSDKKDVWDKFIVWTIRDGFNKMLYQLEKGRLTRTLNGRVQEIARKRL